MASPNTAQGASTSTSARDKPEMRERQRPKINTDTSQSPARNGHHRRRSSVSASPVEISSRSPAARRMSQSSTPQSAVLPESQLEATLYRPERILGGVIIAIVSLGTIYSLIYSTAQDTSHDTLLPNATYFARKSNLINQYFVKQCWFWTSLIYLLHLYSSPSEQSFLPPRSRFSSKNKVEGKIPRLVAFGLSTFCWVIFTTWFFGAGLGDRIIQFSGGACAVALPSEFGSTVETIQSSLGDGLGDIFFSGERAYLSLPSTICALRQSLSSSTHPDLFNALQSIPEFATTYSGGTWSKPRWHKGFDVSGHIFLLTLSTLLLSRELSPSLRMYLRQRIAGEMHQPIFLLNEDRQSSPAGGLLHQISTFAGAGLVGLWIWMLLMTSIWFHTPQEKVSGLLLGLGSYALVHTLTPSSTINVTAPVEKTKITPGPLLEDENRARRGRVIDNDVIMEETEEGSPEIHITPPQDGHKLRTD